jgi:hypothetical protein
MKSIEEVLERGREMYVEIFTSQFSDDVLSMVKGSQLDDTLYAMYHDAAQEGFIKEVRGEEAVDIANDDGSPMYTLSAIKLRSLLFAALTVGMWHQKVTNTLDNMWVDKNPESE